MDKNDLVLPTEYVGILVGISIEYGIIYIYTEPGWWLTYPSEK
jgi:hypothetical protein